MRALGFVLGGQLPELLYRPIVFLAGIFVLGLNIAQPTSDMVIGVFALALMAAYFVGSIQMYQTIPRYKFEKHEAGRAG